MSKKNIISDIEIIHLHTKRNSKKIILNQRFNALVILSILIVILGIVSKILSNHLKIERSYNEEVKNTTSNSNRNRNRNKNKSNKNMPNYNCSPCDENIKTYYRS